MADISAVFGVLIITGIAFPGMLSAWWLLFPASVRRAQTRLEQTPAQCFWFGLILGLAAVIPIVIFLLLPVGLMQFFGWSLLVVLLAFSSLGSAGLAAKMGERLARLSNAGPAASFVRGAVALELAIIFPVLGWVIVFPLTLVTALGATGFALLRWAPKTVSTPIAESALTPVGN